MATKQQVIKALSKIEGAQITIDKGRFTDIEIIAPEGKVWAGNYCSVYCFEQYYDNPMSELWDEVLECIEYGIDDDERLDN